MTIVSGFNINTNPCCGAQYATPCYASMNFTARAHWTDGDSDDALMPGGHGLKKCQCGNFYLAGELLHIGFAEATDVPFAVCVTPEDLPQAIATARTPAIELAARLDYWQHLNHPYRDLYRTHRDAEEAATKAAWLAANTDQRTLLQRVQKVPEPKYVRPTGSPFTYPPFELSDTQRVNLLALQALLTQRNSEWEKLYLAEVHRELGDFEQALQVLQQIPEEDQCTTSRLIASLATEKVAALTRYRM